MAEANVQSILDRYGIKEVADVTFYKIDPLTGKPANPVLYLDSLKVSTVEQTAESVYAQGGKGNAKLIGWDFGKEISLSLEDALFSPKSMAVMFGDGTVDNSKDPNATSIKKTITFKATATDNTALPKNWIGPDGKERAIPNEAKVYDAVGTEVKLTSDYSGTVTLTEGETYFVVFDVKVKGQVITVGPNTFPGTYYITGDTYARSEITGDDEAFQIIIPKGKVTSENTITMEAEGDPSVFNMTVEVLRATLDGKNVMMKLVKYAMDDSEAAALETDGLGA